jgi:hypothetical protein
VTLLKGVLAFYSVFWWRYRGALLGALPWEQLILNDVETWRHAGGTRLRTENGEADRDRDRSCYPTVRAFPERPERGSDACACTLSG